MNKPLEDFFKKKLASNADEGWNVPSDDIWEKALPHFKQEKPKRKFGFWIWWIIATLMLIAGGVWFMNRDEPTKNTTVKVAEVTSPTSSVVDGPTTIIDQDVIKSDIEQSEVILETKNSKLIEKTTKVEKTKIFKKVNSTSLVAQKGANHSPIIEKVVEQAITFQTPNKPFEIAASEIVVLQNNKTESLEIKNTTQSQKIESAPISSTVFNRLPLLPVKVDLLAHIEMPMAKNISTNIKNKNKWAVSASYLPSMSRLAIVPQEATISGNGRYQFSNNFELGVSRALNDRWSLYSGVGLMNIISSSETQKSMVYDKATEIVLPNNVIANPMSFQSDSPLGEFKISTMIKMPSSLPVPDGDIVDAYMTNNQSVRYVYVPVGLRLNSHFRKGLSAFADLGFEYNILIDNETKATGRMMHGQDEMGMELMSTNKLDDLSKSVLSGSLRLGLSKELIPNLSAVSSVGFKHSLTPVFKSTLHTTNFSSFQLNLGFNYSF